MTGLLNNAADLYSVVPRKRLQPITYALTEGNTLLVGAMARVDMVQGTAALCTCYFSHKITLHICKYATSNHQRICVKDGVYIQDLVNLQNGIEIRDLHVVSCFEIFHVGAMQLRTSRVDDMLERKSCVFLYPPHHFEGLKRLRPLVKHRWDRTAPFLTQST